MNLWGRCPSCDRWFYCPSTNQGDGSDWFCPVCGTEPVELENRAAERVASGEAT